MVGSCVICPPKITVGSMSPFDLFDFHGGSSINLEFDRRWVLPVVKWSVSVEGVESPPQ